MSIDYKDQVAWMREVLELAMASQNLWWTLYGVHHKREFMREGFSDFPHLISMMRSMAFANYFTKLAIIFSEEPYYLSLRCFPRAKEDDSFKPLWEQARPVHRFAKEVVVGRSIAQSPTEAAAQVGLSYDAIAKTLHDAVALFNRCVVDQGERPVSVDLPEDDLIRMAERLLKR